MHFEQIKGVKGIHRLTRITQLCFIVLLLLEIFFLVWRLTKCLALGRLVRGARALLQLPGAFEQFVQIQLEFH